MQCPYCTSQIDDAAVVCPQCTRDLYLLKPLYARIAELEAQLASHPAEAEQPLVEPEPPPPPLPLGVAGYLGCGLVPLLLLLGAHALLVMTYDVNTLYLRIASLLLPLPFGWWLMHRYRGTRFGLATAAGFGIGVLAVLGMSTVVGVIDQVNILPANLREWREFLEYAASIGFSYLTGLLLGRHAPVVDRSLVKQIAQAASKGKEGAKKAHEIADRLEGAWKTATALGTTALSAYTGLKDFLGN